MAEKPVVISSDPSANDGLVISLTKKDFGDFVFSLFATPREERKKIKVGYDLTLNDLKVVVDQLNHHISSQNDNMNTEFLCTVSLDDSSDFTVHSYDQFFSTQSPRPQLITGLNLTLSYMIGFNRPEGDKQYEKQTVSILFTAGDVGTVEIDIRSTELTWPIGVIRLIENQLMELSNRSVGPPPKSNPFLFFAPTMAKGGFYKDFRDLVGNLIIVITLLVAIAVISGSSSERTSSAFFPKDSYIYNPSTSKLESVDLGELALNESWQQIAVALENSSTLIRAGLGEYASGESPSYRTFSRVRSKINVWVVLIGVLCFIFYFSNLYRAKILKVNQQSRIFLYTDNIPDRPKELGAYGLIGALVLGALGSLLAVLVQAIFQSVL